MKGGGGKNKLWPKKRVTLNLIDVSLHMGESGGGESYIRMSSCAC